MAKPRRRLPSSVLSVTTSPCTSTRVSLRSPQSFVVHLDVDPVRSPRTTHGSHSARSRRTTPEGGVCRVCVGTLEGAFGVWRLREHASERGRVPVSFPCLRETRTARSVARSLKTRVTPRSDSFPSSGTIADGGPPQPLRQPTR